MVDLRIIRSFKGNRSSPLHCVAINSCTQCTRHYYRLLNNVSKLGRYFITYIHNVTVILQGMLIFIKWRRIRWYPQIGVDLGHILSTAIATNFCLFMYLCVQFGHRYAPQPLQIYINHTLPGLHFISDTSDVFDRQFLHIGAYIAVTTRFRTISDIWHWYQPSEVEIWKIRIGFLRSPHHICWNSLRTF